ncbi:hypothetical protein C8F04DRAFT_1163851 [Mycena alexandri]|uniref:PQ loop repeat protein n=1 Tax=Mycena alexandri TaxID=1745969 RepID=A0AAD6WL35_9AGAR|nr:hypothetical protein C8F04DRAFT_1163851 [Mycena alexandri]
MDGTCTPHHDWVTATLTLVLCVGLIISYLPQHFRIINKGTSEGLSPWFLLLGSTSSAAGFLNMITVQHTQIRCCRVVSIASCVEATAGIVQVGLQWAMFSFIFVLYMIYFPPHLKYEPPSEDRRRSNLKTPRVRTYLWARSVLLANFTVAHFIFSLLLTIFLLLSSPSPLHPLPPPSSPYPDPSPDAPDALPLPLARWALYLGVSSALLAAIQYLPQIAFTWRAKLVGALSVPMMCVQSPGAVAMVLSIALRPGTNWTSWITYAVAGLMQFTLLSICIAWKLRQRRLNVNDFGVSTDPNSASVAGNNGGARQRYRDVEGNGNGYAEAGRAEGADVEEDEEDEPVPGLVLDETEDAGAVVKALESALGEAVAGDVREREGVDGDRADAVGEETPLLASAGQGSQGQEQEQAKGKGRGWW